jgi:hypothetical protein
MTQPPSRRAIHAFVSVEAHEQWHDFAAAEGVSVSALIEAFAPELNDPELGKEPVFRRLEAVVGSARAIDASRRRRRSSN